MNITKSSIDYENGRAYFQLENLFNGDKLLGNSFVISISSRGKEKKLITSTFTYAGENLLHFLNENWKEVTTEIGPAIGEAISEVFRIILTNIADLVPWEYIYPDIPAIPNPV